jgi:membrane protein
MLASFGIRIGWRALLTRTIREASDDDVFGVAAQLAYYFFLALFPALISLIALASLFPLEDFADQVAGRLAPVAPAAVIDIIRQQMLNIAAGDHGGLLSLGLVAALWSSSGAMVAIIGAMNRAFDIDESRSWLKVRLTAIALTIALAIFVLLSFTLVIAGPEIAEAVARRFGLAEAFVLTWKVVQWPVVLVLVSLGIGLIYQFAPDADQTWKWITPGAVVATLLWVAGSIGFRLYVVNFGNYDAAYGTIGGIIVLLLWFYLSGVAIVLGAEVNAEIEHSSRRSPAEPERRPDQEAAIGAAAIRPHREATTGAAGRASAGRLESPAPRVARRVAARAAMTAIERLAAIVAAYALWRDRGASRR